MKALGLILSTLSIMLAGCAGKEEVFTPEMLGEQVIVAFSKNDFKSFHTCYITPKEMKEKLRPEEEDGFLVLYEFIHENAELSYSRIVSQGKENGINWKLAKYKGVEYKIIKEERADIFVNFTASDKCYVLKLEDCLLTTNRGWRLNNDVTFSKIPY
jgi:hypothetical protein